MAVHQIIQKNVLKETILSLNAIPNPFEDIINLEMEMAKNEFVTIAIYNSTGQLIHDMEQYLLEGMNTINLSDKIDLPNGVFFVIAKTDSSTLTRKIIKI